jgi:hypothetical protein
MVLHATADKANDEARRLACEAMQRARDADEEMVAEAVQGSLAYLPASAAKGKYNQDVLHSRDNDTCDVMKAYAAVYVAPVDAGGAMLEYTYKDKEGYGMRGFLDLCDLSWTW